MGAGTAAKFSPAHSRFWFYLYLQVEVGELAGRE